jgi:hypothetical protein
MGNGAEMEEYLRRVCEELIGRVHGPLTFQLVLQPLTVAILATRAAVKDAREGRPAYGWALITDAVRRNALLRAGWREVAKVFVGAVTIDLIYEVVVFHRIYPGQSLIVAAVLALLPYPLYRGSVNRILRLRGKKAEGSGDEPRHRPAASHIS